MKMKGGVSYLVRWVRLIFITNDKWSQDMCKTYIQKKQEDCEELEIDEDGRRGRCGESERHSAGDQDVMQRVDLA